MATLEKLIEKYGFTMTPEQVADVLKLAKDTVLRMLQRKEIPAKKAGSKWIIATENVAKYITSGEVEPAIKVKPFQTKTNKLIL